MDRPVQKKSPMLVFLCALCVISNLSYYPLLVKDGWGRRITITLWIVLGVVILLRMKIPLPKSMTLWIYALLTLLFMVNLTLVTIANSKNAFSSHMVTPVLISFIIFLSAASLQADVTPNGIRTVCRVYFDCMAVISVPLFFLYLRGIDLTSRLYEYRYGKNEISVLFAAALIVGFTVYAPKKLWQHLFRITAVGFMLLDIIYLRCRSVFLCLAFAVLVLVLQSSRLKRPARIILALGIVTAVLVLVIRQDWLDAFLNNIIYAGRDARNMDELSSGRGTQIQKGLETFAQHPLFGVARYGRTLDDFYISVLANYGIAGWPVMVMSVVPLVWGFLQLKQKTDLHLCFFILAGALVIVATLEELAPFGPGTRCYLLWLLWGLLLGRDIPAEEAAAKEKKLPGGAIPVSIA